MLLTGRFNDNNKYEGDNMNGEKSLRLLRNNRGFTLIELMVVMIILGLLAALVVPRMIGKIDPAKQKAAYAQIELFGTALDSFRLDVGRYPEKLEDLQAQPSAAEGWNGPYLKKAIPLDPWDSHYQYRYPGEHGDYDLYSLGADKAEGGDGENMDVVSWKGLK